MNRGVVNVHTAFGHHFLDVPQAERVGNVPTYAGEHDSNWVVQALKHRAQGFTHRLSQVNFHSAIIHPRALIATEPMPLEGYLVGGTGIEPVAPAV